MRSIKLYAYVAVAITAGSILVNHWGAPDRTRVASQAVTSPGRPVQTTDDGTPPPPSADPAALLAAANPMGDMVYGSATAPVTVVEYASLTCIHCHRFFMDTFAGIKLRYIDKGLVRWIVREYASDGLATDAMMLARCVGRTPQGSLTAFEAIMRSQPFFLDPMHPEGNGPTSLIRAVGPSLGVGRDDLDACLDDRRVYDAINRTYKAGRDGFGVAETPTFFVDGEPILGNRPLDEFRDVLDRHIGEARLTRARDHEMAMPRSSGSLDAWNTLPR